jgi:hypothetical protein
MKATPQNPFQPYKSKQDRLKNDKEPKPIPRAAQRGDKYKRKTVHEDQPKSNTPKLVYAQPPFFHSNDFVVSLFLSFLIFLCFCSLGSFLAAPLGYIAPCILFHFLAPLPIKAQSIFPFLTVHLTGSPMERLSKFPSIPHRNLLYHFQQMTAP